MDEEIVRGQTWQHADGGIYTIENLCKLKPRKNSEWVEGVIYHQQGDPTTLCVRKRNNFLSRFTRVTA